LLSQCVALLDRRIEEHKELQDASVLLGKSKAKRSISGLVDIIKALEGDKRDLQQDLRNAKRDRKSASSVAQEVQDKQSELEKELKKARLRAQTLAADLSTERANAAKLREATERGEARCKEVEFKLQNAEKERDRSQQAEAAAHHKVARYTNEYDKLEARLEQSIPKDVHEKVVEELNKKLAADADRMASLDKKFKQLWGEMKTENLEIRNQASELRRDVAKERERANKEEQRAREASQQVKALDVRVRDLEREATSLRALVKSVKEQSQIMRTIAKIRTETSHGGESIGFDKLVQTIDKVHEQVERQCFLSGITS